MPTPGERFKSWLEGLSLSWKDRLRGWMASWLGFGIETFANVLAAKASQQLQVTIASLEARGIPPVLSSIIAELKHPTGEIAALSGVSFLNRVIGGIKGDIFEYFTRSLTHAFSYSADFYLPGPEILLEYYFRGIIPSIELLYDKMRSHGIPPEETNKLISAKLVRFPSQIVAPAWLRDKAKYERYWKDVAAIGVSPDRIELLKELAYQMPSFRDVVGFLAHEVLEPEMIRKYGLDDEWGGLDKTLFEKVGLREDMALNYWRDHWQHASYSQVMEMLHRGVISEQDVYDWFRLVEIPPYWREGLTRIMYNLPGRIEVRMMAQYGLIDKATIMDLLRKDGLAEEYLEVVADMNLVRGIRSDIQTRYMKGWLNSEQVRAEIATYNLAPQIAERLYQWIVKNVGPERTAKELDLTVANVVKGVKKGIITWDEGLQRLVTLGLDEDEAAFRLAIDIEVVQEEPTSELTVRTDTIRRQRRQRLISKEDEVTLFIALGLDSGLAMAYADNDDLRLVKET